MKHNCLFRVFCLLLALALLTPTAFAADRSGAAEAIEQGYETGSETIELKEYDLGEDDLREIFYDLKNNNHLPWYANTFRYTYNSDTGVILSMTPENLDETTYSRNEYERAVAQVLAEAVLPGMSQWQIVLSVHDYFVSHYRYDESYTFYEGYDLLVGETAVCEGYARAYMDVLKRAGLEVIYASSESMNHAWNLVKIGNEWYHVDVTWDDPTSDCYGKVRHHHFLLDDETISDEEHEHYDWVTSQTADSSDLTSDAFWLGVESAICYESASVSYLRKTDGTQMRIYRRNEQTGELTELVCIEEGYIDVGRGSYHYENWGLSLWNGKLYFSDMANVYSMNTDGSDLTTIYTYDAEANGLFIRGSFVDDGIIHITLDNHDGELRQSLEVSVPGATGHEHSYTETRVEPTCDTDGFITYQCSCGISYQGETLAATGHSYASQITREPSGDSDGEMTYTCSRCGHSYTEPIPADGSSSQQDTPPVTTYPPVRETEPSGKKEDGGFSLFPLILIVAAVPALVIVLLLILLLTKKKPKKTGSGARRSGKPQSGSGSTGDSGFGYGYGSDGSSGYGDSYGSGESGYDGSYGSGESGYDGSYGSGESGYADSYGSDGGFDDSYSGGGYSGY